MEFRVGDSQDELGIIDRRFAPKGLTAAKGTVGGVVTFWHVDDVTAALERLLSMGATPLEAITERGPGFITASVVDPFGNVLGIMFNRHYLDASSGRGAGAEGA